MNDPTDSHRPNLPLDGIRVVEVASWTFVPSGGSVLVDWGAEVIKVEHPVTGDPQRGLITSGLVPGGAGGVNFMIEQPNRGKRSIGLNLAHPDGREMLLKLVETADVFLTNYMPPVRQQTPHRHRRPSGTQPSASSLPGAPVRAPTVPMPRRAATTGLPSGPGEVWEPPCPSGPTGGP